MLQVIVNVTLKSFNYRKEAWAMQKLFIKERKRKSIEKMDECPRYLKQWVLRCPSKKREMNKIAHIFLQKCFQSINKRDMFQGA